MPKLGYKYAVSVCGLFYEWEAGKRDIYIMMLDFKKVVEIIEKKSMERQINISSNI